MSGRKKRSVGEAVGRTDRKPEAKSETKRDTKRDAKFGAKSKARAETKPDPSLPHDHVQFAYSDEIQPDQPLFYIDTGAAAKAAAKPAPSPATATCIFDNRGAAWVDADDQNVVVDVSAKNRLKKLGKAGDAKQDKSRGSAHLLTGTEYIDRLREFNEKINPRPKWAAAYPDNDDDSGRDGGQDDVVDADEMMPNSILHRPFELIEAKSRTLTPDMIRIKRLADANAAAPANGPIHALHFHPTLPLLLAGGEDRAMRIFDIDGRDNPLVHSVRLRDLNVRSAAFLPDGNQVLLTGNKPILYRWNLLSDRMERVVGIRGRNEKMWKSFKSSPCGTFVALAGDAGTIVIISGKSLQFITSLKMNGTVTSMEFSPDGRYLFSAGHDDRIYQWDSKANWKCVRGFPNETGTQVTRLSISPDREYLISASNLGVASIWNYRDVLEASETDRIKPWKTLMNLTTYVSAGAFHPSSQLYAYSSDEIRNALRLVHFPTGRVFSNWPAISTPLGHVESLDFSSDQKYFAMGNRKGVVLLYSLNYFDD